MPLFNRNDPGPDPALRAGPDRWKPALDAVLRAAELAASAGPSAESSGTIVRLAADLLRATQASVMLLEDDRNTLRLVAYHGPLGHVPAGHRVPVGDGALARVLATSRPLLLGDVDHSQLMNLPARGRSISSSIVVPLRAEGRAIGVMNLAFQDSPASFTDEDLGLAAFFADQAAATLERVRLSEQITRWQAALPALAEVSRSLAGESDLDRLLELILEGGLGLVEAGDGFSCLFDTESGAMAQGVFRGIDKDSIRALIELEDVKEAIAATTVRVIPEESVVAVGLGTGEGPKGVLVLRTPPPEPARLALLRVFGDRCNSAFSGAEGIHAAERARAELSSIVSGVPDPIVVVDAKRRLVAANPAAETLFGLSSVFSAGDDIRGRLGNETIESLMMAEGKMTEEIVTGTPTRTFVARLNDITLGSTPLGRVLVMDEVTVERAIAQTQRDFVSMIGHELRTPLTLVKGYARTLLKRAEKGTLTAEDASEPLSTIDARAGQLERLIEDLLYVSRIETREASLRLEDVDVHAMILSAGEDLRHDHPDRNIDLDIPEGLDWRCDETKIGLVVRHLLENALKYSEEPAPVSVRAATTGDELLIEVSDKGMGILSSEMPHIFDRFRQVDGSSTRRHGGTGIGLYICAQLIKMHDGRIWADSIWGKGSTFSIALPRRVDRPVTTESSPEVKVAP